MSTNAIFVIAQRGFSAQVEIKIGIRRNEKKSISREQIRPVEIRLKNILRLKLVEKIWTLGMWRM